MATTKEIASEKQPQSSLDNHKATMAERGDLAMLKKKVEDRIKELDETLRPVLEGRGELVYGGFSFKCVLTQGRKSIDKDALASFLAQHGKKPTDFEKEGAPFTTMTVKAVSTL